MRSDRPVWPAPGIAAALWLLFTLVMAYSSTVIGPMGLHFVPRDPAAALQALLRVRFVANGSDQRADWMGNLMMLIPHGFLTLAMLWPRRSGRLIARAAAVAAAAMLDLIVILAVKYAQLFFPPRTVTLNYITAQSLGACAGLILWIGWYRLSSVLLRRPDPAALLVAGLRLYLLALAVFLLEPLDFALSPTDLLAQLHRLPETLGFLPGDGRPLMIRLLVLVAGTAAFVPVGMLLSFRRVEVWRVARPPAAATLLGFYLAGGIYLTATLVMGAYPLIGAVLYRTLGAAIGAYGLHLLLQLDAEAMRRGLARAVPLLVLAYLLLVLAANRVLGTTWIPVGQAIAHSYKLGLIPLFDYYIVPKADAAKNIVGHALMYLPIGVLVWLRAPGRDRAGLAAALAVALALPVEAARYLRPGLEGDINAIAIAGLSAFLTARAMPVAWRLLLALHPQPAAPMPAATLGEVEDF